MKSNIKMLIAAGIAVVVLAAAVVILMLTADTENTETTTEETAVTVSEQTSRLIYDKDPATIENIHIKNENGEFDIKKFADDAWFIPEYIDFTHNVSAVSDALNGAATVTSQQIASEDAEDMSVYGLSTPAAQVTISFSDGEKVLNIGKESPSPGLTYLSFGDEKTVYAVNTSEVDCFLNDKFSYVAKTVYTPRQPVDENDTTDYQKVDRITIKRKDLSDDIVLEYDVRQDSEEIITGNSSSHIMTNPVRLDLNPDASYNVINNVFNLTASEIAVMAPSEETKAQFGLDEPFGEVAFEIAGETFRFYIGNEAVDSEGKKLGYYCMAEGINIIYLFSGDTIPWATVQPLDITMEMITSTYIYSISEITVQTADSKTVFALNGDDKDFAVTADGKEINADEFKNFYQYILRAPAEELYLEKTDAPADLTVSITNPLGTDVIEFISSDDRKSVIRLNGRVSFKCRTAYADRLSENLANLLSGGEIIGTW